MLRSFSSSTLTRQTIQRITSSTTTSRSINFKPITSHSRLLTLSTTRQPSSSSSSSSSQRIHTRSALSSRSSIESSSAVARLAQQHQVQQQHRRHRCTCAHHNQISMSLDGVDKSMGVITGGVAEMAGQRDAYRLPTEVIPTHYDLVFKTDLEGLTFEGEGLIHLDIAQSTNSIQFNLNPSVHLTKISVILPSGEEIHYDPPSPIRASESGDDETPGETNRETEPTRVTVDLDDIKAGEIKVDKDQERFALGLPSGKLEKGAKGVKVRAAWKDVLGGSMMGYYRSSFPHEDGKDTYYALTQFEPTAARRAYPAWDEPAIKATYSIALLGRKGLVSLGNMPVEHEAEWTGALEYDGVKLGENLTKAAKGEEWTLTKFEKTPLVSSYLVAFAHGPFASLSSEYTSPLTGKVIPLKIYATPDLIGQAQFALDVKRMALPVYEEIFDVPYPLPKLDTLVAHDFDAGAMENWGLITGRTTAYLYDEKKSSLAAKKRIIDVQSHECAHMWFGNIVSPKWWDVLWLNEAFATLQGEVIIPDRIFPEFKVRREFLTTHLIAALSLDAVRSSHPIEVPCPDANQINQIFDSISYSKGASVLRMLAAVVGEDKFLKGVSIYLKKHLYGNASTKDLWAGISEASGVDVTRIMNEWILNVGFPVISVEELDGGKRIKVRQDRFLNTGDVKPEENKTIWYVPLELKTVVDGKVSVDHKAILSERELEIDLNGASAFKLNAETVGVYRVAYSPERLAKLGEEAAKPDSIFSVEDRIGLVSDATTLARAGSGKTSGSLNLVSKLGGETEYAVWDSIAVGLGKLKAVWWEQPEDVRKAIDKFRNKLFKPIVERMGFDFGENDDPDTRQLRTLAISVAAGSEDAETIAEIQKRFKPFLENGDDSQIPPDLQRCIYTIAVRHGGEAEWKKIREVYDKPPTASAKIDALMSLGATQKPELIEKTFTMLHDGSIKDQDVMYGFVSLSSNRLATRKVAAYFKDNYKTMMKRFGDNFAMNRLVTYAFNSLTTEKDLKEVDDFFKDKDNSKYKLSLAQVRDTIMAQSHWLIRDQEDVKQWLKDNKYL